MGPDFATRGVDYPAMETVIFVSGMGFVGVVVAEFVFLYLIAARYQPLDSYIVRRNILQAIINAAFCQGTACPEIDPVCSTKITKGTNNLPEVKRQCTKTPPLANKIIN